MLMSADNKKERIINAAINILVKKGYSEMTITGLTRESGLSRGLLHYYFKDKEDILLNVMISIYDNYYNMASIKEIPAKNPTELAKAMTFFFKATVENSPEVFQLNFDCLYIARQSPKLEKSFMALLRKTRKNAEADVREMMEAGVIRDDISAEAMVTMFIALVDGLALQFVYEPDIVSDQNIWEEVEKSMISLLAG
jgi:AcrR family transcriptional regulator